MRSNKAFKRDSGFLFKFLFYMNKINFALGWGDIWGYTGK